MNVRSKATTTSAICLALALACGGTFAQSAGGGGGGTSGSSGSAQGQAGQSRNGQGAGGTAGGANGMNGAAGTTRGCENLATSGPQRLPEPARPVGTPTRGAANKGSWNTQPNCANGQGSNPQNGQGGATRTPSSGGGAD